MDLASTPTSFIYAQISAKNKRKSLKSFITKDKTKKNI
ncbi:uncharacterized protein FFB20_06870 [Fusarium fujikuroi]|nr:uncharacterized protein FFB20_06870 [Fusarium fujikuroi]SCO09312.1 uncharacterized protein FFC1_11079 [Fusarium fujikuroi]SCO21636.1 uncharacterized protein FFE2_14984 [Fusarium fujikuroi]SCO26357.1 uncharacterized protein FFM5_14626 [Fusarium fujikuroi]SCO53494.1 uncharacterized protein FFNC_14936 [Fusarium fujikuroi]